MGVECQGEGAWRVGRGHSMRSARKKKDKKQDAEKERKAVIDQARREKMRLAAAKRAEEERAQLAQAAKEAAEREVARKAWEEAHPVQGGR